MSYSPPVAAASFTLKDLLGLGSMSGARLLSGSRLDVPITRANVVEIANMADWAKAGECVISSGYLFRDREELLEEFLRLSREEGVTILFSTHITSDLDRCADEILYLRKGRLAERGSREELVKRYRLVASKEKPVGSLGACPTAEGWTALYRTEDAPEGKPASLEDIMVHLEKGGEA